MRRGLVAAAALGAVALLSAGCGNQTPAAVSTDPIPTATTSAQGTECGGLPRRAAELALGREDLRFDQTGAPLDEAASAGTAGCFVYPEGEKKWVLDVSYREGAGNDNQGMLDQYQQGPKKDESLLPSDLGTGLISQPWTSKSPSAQATLMDGERQLQITLLKAPKERDQAKDVLALARLLKPIVLG